MRNQQRKQEMLLQVTEDLTVKILPNSSHEFLMSTKEVAKGYDVAVASIRSHKYRYQTELKENIHFIKGVAKSNAGSLSTTYIYWTKQGVIRLGFFIKSERAKLFRDWIEQLVLKFAENKLPALPKTKKRKHNRLTQERLLDIMADIVKIENAELRLSISEKILGETNNE